MLRSQIFKALTQAPGSVFSIKKTLTSSGITTSAQDLTGVSTGELEIIQAYVKTDATGLAGGTNFVLSTTNAKGVVNFAVETVANLGANATKVLAHLVPAADTTTSDAAFSVTAMPTVLEAGKKIQYNMTASAGTGAGTIDIYIVFRRVANGASIQAA